MTLSDMAAFVCAKVRKRDATSVALCKEFLATRYEMLYADQLWRASLYTHAFTVPVAVSGEYANPNATATGEAGMYFMPELVDRVLGVRREDARMHVFDELEIFKGDMDEYSDTDAAGAVKFTIVSPAVFYVQNPIYNSAARQLKIALFSATDATAVFTIRLVDHNEQALTMTGVAGATLFHGAGEWGTRLVESITHPVLSDEAFLYYAPLADEDFSSVARSRPGSTTFSPRQRIRIYPKPGTGAAAKNYVALVKRKCLPLDNDNAEPMLAGIENCLMAFAQSDLLQYCRQYGKSQAGAQEGLALLEQFKRLEVVQQAHRMRIIPHVSEVAGTIDYGWAGKGEW